MIVCYLHCLFHYFNQWFISLTKLAMSAGVTLIEMVQLLLFTSDIHRIMVVSLTLSPVLGTLSLNFVLGKQHMSQFKSWMETGHTYLILHLWLPESQTFLLARSFYLSCEQWFCKFLNICLTLIVVDFFLNLGDICHTMGVTLR